MIKSKEVLKIIDLYIAEVNATAEEEMLKTGKLEGAHHRAMKTVRKKFEKLALEIERE